MNVKARVHHLRRVVIGGREYLLPTQLIRQHFLSETVQPKGGATFVEILDGDDVVGVGEAYCNTTDSYNKDIGRTIALGRAMG